MKHITTIIDKEWSEVFRNRMVLYTMIFLPLFFIVLSWGMIYFLGTSVDASMPGEFADVPPEFLAICGDGATATDCMQIYLVNMFMLLFMMMPVIIPVTIAGYSVIGEKTTRTLEPLLATPISTFELLAGKSLAAAVPAIVIGWLSFGIFLVGLFILGVSPVVIRHIVSPTWLLGVLLASPLMAIAATNFALYVSSRVNDPRVAEQISVLLIIPILAGLIGQLAGWIVIDIITVLSFIGALVLLDIGMIYLGVTIFERETILTRWK